jgi:hypothetical protein
MVTHTRFILAGILTLVVVAASVAEAQGRDSRVDVESTVTAYCEPLTPAAELPELLATLRTVSTDRALPKVLAAKLAADDPRVVLRAVTLVAELRPNRPWRLLEPVIETGDADCRTAAVAAVIEGGDGDATEELIDLWLESDPAAPVVGEISAHLRDGNPALGYDALDTLVDTVGNAKLHPSYRTVAATALRYIFALPADADADAIADFWKQERKAVKGMCEAQKADGPDLLGGATFDPSLAEGAGRFFTGFAGEQTEPQAGNADPVIGRRGPNYVLVHGQSAAINSPVIRATDRQTLTLHFMPMTPDDVTITWETGEAKATFVVRDGNFYAMTGMPMGWAAVKLGDWNTLELTITCGVEGKEGAKGAKIDAKVNGKAFSPTVAPGDATRRQRNWRRGGGRFAPKPVFGKAIDWVIIGEPAALAVETGASGAVVIGSWSANAK